MSRSLNLLLLAMVCAAVSGFVAPSTGRKSSNTSLQAESSRRNFVDVAFGAALVGLASPAFALDDLSMPTEQKTKEVSFHVALSSFD